tara:strand:+ start:456 stop:614 length:159 start_codon:yes stop_codon:yes gene_type:complete
MKLFTMTGAMLGSYGGWVLAEPLGIGWAIVISGITALIGVYVGWKIGRRWLE